MIFSYNLQYEKSFTRNSQLATRNSQLKRGFTLVELSIAIVIVGLLIGGILIGQSLIESAKINAQIRQLQQYDIAINNFKQKFKQIPGDSNLGFQTWIVVSDNDGFIESGVNEVPAYSLWAETYYFFINLSKSGMINETYKEGAGAYNSGKGNQFPIAAISNTNHGIFMIGNTAREIFYALSLSNPNTLNANGISSSISPTGIMSTKQALAIDSKTDDSNPASGNVVAITQVVNSVNGGVPYPMTLDTTTCTDSGAYDMAETDKYACRLLVKVNLP